MATFNIVLDKRTKLKNDKYNLAIRLVNVSDVLYINISKMTEKQYDQIFVKKAQDKESIQFRETCNGYISKCENIFSQLKPFNKIRFRERFKAKDIDIPQTLILSKLFDYYVEKSEDLMPKTKDSLKYTRNRFENFMPGISVGDVTVGSLKKFESKLIGEGTSRATLDHHLRNLRTIINYFKDVVKVIPEEYEYPFGKGGFTISTYFPSKQVLKETEIKSVIELQEFKTKEHEFARDVWVFLYRCNGANFADLLRMKWSQLDGDYILFTRKKTESTRKNNKKQIIVPVTDKLKDSISRIGDINSKFLLGQLKEDYDESSFRNRSHKIKQQINRSLKDIRNQLKLSRPLQLGCARDCYANTLNKNDVSMKKISQMLGHSNVLVTEHYLAGLDPDITFGINESIL